MTAVGKIMLIGLVVLAAGSVAWAEPEEGAGATDTSVEGLSTGAAIAIVGACFGAGMCAIGGGLAIAKIGAQCIDAIARQPEAASSMFAPMIISAAMAEGGMLFAIVVCLFGVMAAG